MRRLFGRNPADQPLDEEDDEDDLEDDFHGSFHGSQHSGAPGSVGVSSRRSQDRGSVTRRLPHRSCETCHTIIQPDDGVRCFGCEKWTHEHCLIRLDIGNRYHALLCLTCNQAANRNLRIVGANDLPYVRLNKEDEWFRRVLENQARGVRMGSGTPTERELQTFFYYALGRGLTYWEQEIISPTERASPPHVEQNVIQAGQVKAPPGLPASSSGINVQRQSVGRLEPRSGSAGIQAGGEGSHADEEHLFSGSRRDRGDEEVRLN